MTEQLNSVFCVVLFTILHKVVHISESSDATFKHYFPTVLFLRTVLIYNSVVTFDFVNEVKPISQTKSAE